MRYVVTSRRYESGFGKIPTTLVLRRISLFSRSSMVVEEILRRPDPETYRKPENPPVHPPEAQLPWETLI